jgi:hypothetical protein
VKLPAGIRKGLDRFQDAVWAWMRECFSSTIQSDIVERQDRFLEEVFELLQSLDYPRDRIRALEHYVYNRSPGLPFQEVGGVGITLAALLTPLGISMGDAFAAEHDRIWTKVDAIRAKQASKPVGSALPAFMKQGASEDVFDIHVTVPLPLGWFVDQIKHEHTRILYAGDIHSPIATPDGAWYVALQHYKGGRLTWAYGHTMAEAWNHAVSVVNREKSTWSK